MSVVDMVRAASRPRRTVCPFCGQGCSLLLSSGTSWPLRHHAVSQGALCVRGWSAGEVVVSPLRVDAAYVRRDGGPLAREDVRRAISQVAERLAAIRERHGPGSIGILGSARITVEEAQLLRRLADTIGTPHLDTLQRIGYLPFPPQPLDAIENASRITVLAANLTVRHPQAGRRVLRALDRGAHLRFVHSRRAQLSSLAAEHVVALPGHELDRIGPVIPEELVLVSSEMALSGRGAETAQRLAGRRVLFLTDYVNQRGAVEAGLAPSPDGLSAWEMLNAAAEGALKALLVFADDPFEFFPALSARAFARAELTLVVDAVKSRSASRADIVLPGALLAEKHGTVVNTEGRAQELAAAAPPLTPWSEAAVAAELIRRFGGDEAAGAGPRAGGDAPGAVTSRGATTPGTPLAPSEPPGATAPEPPGFPTPRGLAPETPSGSRPFLAALDTTLFWNSHALLRATVSAWREARNLFADFPPGCITLNPDDARALGISYAGAARVESADGAVTLPARLHPRMLPGTVWIAMPCWERCGSKLGALAFDPVLRIPVFVPRAVRVGRPGPS